MECLTLVHRKSGRPFPSGKESLWWSTCLRQIGFYLTPVEELDLSSQDETYSHIEAQEFLLEVICGLHSPIVGETEVLGQFRQFLQDQREHELMSPLLPLFQKLLHEAKRIREKFFVGMGSQSYGSLTRRLLQENQEVSIVGGGQLVQEILPWLSSTPAVHIFLRNPSKGAHLKDLHRNLMIHSLTEAPRQALADVLLIAAPVSHDFLSDALRYQNKLDLVIDFRGDGSTWNGALFAERFYDLSQFMNLSQQQKDNCENQKRLALSAIGEWKCQQLKSIQVRPFGWEDMCG